MNDRSTHSAAFDAGHAVHGGRCDACGHFALPHPKVCSACMSEALTAATVTGEGTVYSSTVVRSGRKDRPLPYGLAYVDLAAGIRVMAGYEVNEQSLDPGSAVVVAEVGRSEAGLPLLRVVDRAQPHSGERVVVTA